MEDVWAFSISFFLHVLLITLLSATSRYLPLSDQALHFDTLWLSASSLPMVEDVGAGPFSAPVSEAAEPSSAPEGDPAEVSLQEQEMEAADVESSSIEVMTTEVERPVSRPRNTPATQAPQVHAPPAMRTRLLLPITVEPTLQTPHVATGAALRLDPFVAATPRASQLPQQTAGIPVAGKEQRPSIVPAEKMPLPAHKLRGNKNLAIEGHLGAADSWRQEEKVAVLQNSVPPPGTVVPSVHGELKVVMSAGDDVKLTVLFREYPKEVRRHPIGRSSAIYRTSPCVIKIGPQQTEVVIETVKEGVYIIVAEHTGGNPAEVDFTFKLFELSTRRRIRALGTRVVSAKTTITKVLMPEGIFWDDEGAFSGSIEDSNSTTKFNAESGLYWKEYTD